MNINDRKEYVNRSPVVDVLNVCMITFDIYDIIIITIIIIMNK